MNKLVIKAQEDKKDVMDKFEIIYFFDYSNLKSSRFLKGKIFESIPSEVLQPLLGTKVQVTPNWLRSSLDIPTIFFDKAIIPQIKNQLELLKEVLANRLVSPDYAMEVVSYGK